MKVSHFRIKQVKEVPGFLPAAYQHTSKGSPYVSHHYKAKSLLIKGTMEGELVSFFTPSVVISVGEGFINYEELESQNGWYKKVEGTMKGHKGDPMFDGGKGPNIAIEDTSKIVPAVKVGDVIEIKYLPKGSYKGIKTIKNVKLVEIIKN